MDWFPPLGLGSVLEGKPTETFIYIYMYMCVLFICVVHVGVVRVGVAEQTLGRFSLSLGLVVKGKHS